jgi:hypothetical protein
MYVSSSSVWILEEKQLEESLSACLAVIFLVSGMKQELTCLFISCFCVHHCFEGVKMHGSSLNELFLLIVLLPEWDAAFVSLSMLMLAFDDVLSFVSLFVCRGCSDPNSQATD